MQNSFFKQLGKTAKDQAKLAAKQIANEPTEIVKSGTNQIRPIETKQIAPEVSVIQELMTGGGSVKEVSPQEEQSIHAQARNRLQEIEAEIRRLRMEREQKSQDYAKQQQELLNPVGQQQKQESLVMPSSGHKKGPRGPREAKKGSREIGKQYGA